MENYGNHYQMTMTRFFLSFLLLNSFSGFGIAQDTLIEQNSVMYSKYYVLHENNRFEFLFHHCTGISYGRGKVNKSTRRWKFEFDSLSKPSISYSCSNIISMDSIRFEFRNNVDSSQFLLFDNVAINQKKYFTMDSVLTIPKNNISGDSIQLVIGQDSLTISEKITDYSLVTLYINDGWKTYINGGVHHFVRKHGVLYLVQEVDVKALSEYYKKAKRGKLYYRYKKI